MKESAPRAGTFLKHSTIYAIGTVLRQLASFLMLPVYTHFLSPADYGVVGLLTFSLALMEPFLGARLGDAIPKFYLESDDADRRRAVLSASLTITGMVSGLAAVGIFLCRNPVSSLLFGSDKFGLVVGLFGFQIVTQAIEYYGLTFIRIQQRPLLFIWVNITKLVLQLGLNIWLIAFLKMGVMGVIVSGGVSSALYAIGLTIYILIVVGYRFDRTVAKQMLLFNYPLWFSGLAGLYILQSNRFYIRVFGSLDQLGLLELAMKFAGILTFLAWSPFAQVWDVERFNFYRDDKSGQRFANVFRLISALLIAVGLGISIFAGPAINIMSTVEFHRAALSVPMLTLASIFISLILFLNFGFLVSGNTKQIAWNNYITMALITALNLALIPKLGEIGAALALMLAMLFQLLLTEKTAKRHFDMHIRFGHLVLPLALGALAYVLANHVLNSSVLWKDLIGKTLVYMAFMVILVWSLWRDRNTRSILSSALRPITNRLPGFG